MNVLLEAYLERNFGDDLFVTLLINRYGNHRFYLLDDRNKGYALVGDSKFGNVCLITEEEAFSDMRKFGAYLLVGGDFYHANGDYYARVRRAKAIHENGGYVLILGASLYKTYPADRLPFVQEFFRYVDVMTLREGTSYAQCEALMPDSCALLSSDMAFTLASEYGEKQERNGIQKLGISVRRKMDGTEEQFKVYCKTITDVTIAHLKANEDNRVCFLALSTSGFDDRDVIDQIRGLLPHGMNNRIDEIEYSRDVYSFMDEVSTCDALICTRFHSLCLALIQEKPFFPINYEAKVENLLKDIGFSGTGVDYGVYMAPEAVLQALQANRVDEEKYREYVERAGHFFDMSDFVLDGECKMNEEYGEVLQKLTRRIYEKEKEIEGFEEIKSAALSQQKATEKAIQMISELQKTKTYKLSLLFRRSKQQILIERQRKDFLKWILEKVTKKDFHTRKLREFDYLEHAKRVLELGQSELEEIGLDDDPHYRHKNTQRVFVFASVPFYDVGGGQRSSQLARTFNSLGKQVYYIHAYPCAEENVPDMAIPVSAHKYVEDIQVDWFKRRVQPGDLAIFELPCAQFEGYLDCAKAAGAYTVYEHIDNWDTSLGCLFYQEDVFTRYLEKADLITVTARMLGEKIAEKCSRPYLYLPNAVNIEIFEPSRTYARPEDLVVGRKKTLLYFGSLWGEWFDWEKIDYVARHCPDCAINLIGDCSGCRDRMTQMPKNVHFLGIKKQTDLPAYLAYTDLALLPFKNCEIGKYVSPLKIFEYIAMNVRVLATPLDDIQNYPNVVCSDTNEGWAEAVETNAPVQDSSVFISQNNWFARCQRILECADSVRKSYPSVSVIVLNHNNKSVIRRCVDTLLAHRQYAGYEVIVVDNQSEDGSFEMLKEEYADRIVLVQNDQNGCSSGRNLGVKVAQGEYICFLDSDQWVISDLWLENSLHLLEQEDRIGAVGWAAGWFSPGKVAGPIGDYYELRGIRKQRYAYRRDIAYLGSGGLVMRKQLFEQIGGFDEAYDPTCFEDTDLSLSIRHAGYELAYCPSMPIMHLPHQTTNSGSSAHQALMDRNGKYFMDKWKRLQPELLEYYLDEASV